MREIDLAHFNVPEPLLIGMSGGRTSAFQLHCFLRRLGGKITGRRKVCFANTGDEDERTLKFIERVSLEWGVEVVWLEYRFEPFPEPLLADPMFRALRQAQVGNRKDSYLRGAVAGYMECAGFPGQAESVRKGRECLNGRDTFAVVNYATASRDKGPYDAMLRAREAYRRDVKGLRGVVPNPPQRLCTGQLKMRTMYRYLRGLWGLSGVKAYNVALALRADESHRADSALAREVEAGVLYFPLADAGVKGDDVAAFWREQPFDLGMKSYEGNCRNCFMKKRHAVEHLIRQRPESADWWAGWEARTGDRFRRDRPSYAAMKWQAQHQPLLFPEPGETESVITCEGGYCSD